MRLTYLAIFVIVVALLGGMGALALRPQASSSKVSVAWELPGVNGGIGRASQYLGKVTLVNFWASWCGTCREEMPDIVQTYRDYKDRGLVVVGINYGEAEAPAQEFVRQFGMEFPTFLDQDKAVAGKYGVISMPTSFLLGKDGQVKLVIPGQIDFQAVRPQIDKLLTE